MYKMALTPPVIVISTILMTLPTPSRAELPEKAAQYHRDLQSGGEGISIAEVRGDDPASYGVAGHLREGGPAVDEKTLFEIGSITKAFTGILLADAVLKKKATLEDPISRHLPADLLAADSPLHAVTLLDLATHTSGLPRLPANLEAGSNPLDPYAHFDEAKLLACLRELTEAGITGKGEMNYSNLGVGLLGYLLERISGKPYPELVKETIFAPLGMDSSFVQVSPGDIPASHRDQLATGHAGGKAVSPWHLAALAGAGGIVSSAHDMMLFAHAHWSPDTPESLREALSLAASPQRKGMGLCWFIVDEGLSHDGGTGGFRSEFRLSPPEKSATLLLMNGTGPSGEAGSTGDFSGLTGYWEGTLVAGEVKLRQVFRISENGRIVLHSLDQGGAGIPANKSVHEAGVLRAIFGGIGGSYEAKVEGDTLTGTWKQGGDLPLTLKRTDTVPPALIAALASRVKGDPAKLKGYWSGYLGGKAGLFVILEIDAFGGTGEARLYSPDQTPEPIPVSSLSIDGDKLTLSVDIIKATFAAEIDDTGKLSGAWKQGPLPLPLSLTKSATLPEREE
jgi:CubicO group peptidase (beta-lactamase class C family)